MGMFIMSEEIAVKILFFATIKDRTRCSGTTMALDKGVTVNTFKQMLIERFPNLEPLKQNMLVSINQEFGQNDDLIPDQAEVGVFPAVSGGSAFPTILKVTKDVIEVDPVLEQLTSLETGAICSFFGVIRGKTKRYPPYKTIQLEYEAYVPMAEMKMAQIADEIRERWPDVQGIAIIQRIGKLDPMTTTVFIGCSAAHRDTGVFEASRYAIDRLKQIVPVWKKEIGPDGEEWVEGDYIPGRGD